ncbi:MAG: acyl-CoA dehydrogenase [Burkholderiales bacterium]
MIWLILGAVVAVLALAYVRATGPVWAIATGGFLVAWLTMESLPDGIATSLLGLYVLIASVLNFPALRRKIISDPLLKIYRSILPAMSQTEQEAIDAGTVWWDGELFSGAPNWNRLLDFPKPSLSAEEQAFLNNECEELCAMANDWETTEVYQDLSPQVWQYIKDKGFLGMIIPKNYGGKGFSALMHSQVIQKLSTRCSAAAVSVMVPNSLGPAELLLHYGTDLQRQHYLPRLAKGLEIPCFGLTNPHAGSDAAAIPDVGIVCKAQWQGNEVLGMRVTWEKRYITLGPISTLLGLAVRLHDPDRLLGGEEDLGITCLLVPTDTPGVNIGRRHMPLNAVFQNGPNWGKDVFMPLSWIIGGQAMAGQGWRMLMECLAAGRSISLPSSAVGYAKLAARSTGAYARVRSQFKTAIGKFEGVEEALARIGGNLYLMDATRSMTAGAVDQGEKPSVISAVAKYHLTERGRSVVNDAMDILGGKGICLGPSNFMGRAYQQLPIAITVEGANILTRSLIIFGQGAIRAHPYVLAEMNATRETNPAKASSLFDAALWGHVRFAVANKARAFVLAISGSRFASTPEKCAPETRRYYQHLTRFSSAFAFLSDVSMLVLGGNLKRREKLSARLGDILSLLYLGSCTLKRYEDEGRRSDDLPLVQWAMEDTLAKIQAAFDGVLDNFPNALISAGLRLTIFPLGQWFCAPSDDLGHAVARLLISPSATRDRLTAGMFLPKSDAEVVGALEAALNLALEAEAVEAKIRSATKNGALSTVKPEGLADAALAANIINASEHALLARFSALRDQVIAVDHFPQDFGRAEVAAQAEQRAAA